MWKDYSFLLEEYYKMFEMVDAFHFNSQNTAEVYRRFLNVPNGSKIIPITHSGIGDHRKRRLFDSRVLRMGFVGSEAPYKGLPMLRNVIGRLNESGYEQQIQLNIYGGKVGKDCVLDNINYRGRFDSSQMESVYEAMDLLVVPSIWFETFSFTTIEALQYGVPVLVSDKVGAKDIVKKYAPLFIFKGKDNLYDIISQIIKNRSLLRDYNNNIMRHTWDFSLEKHSQNIVNELYKIKD